jgi:hypothetical protein
MNKMIKIQCLFHLIHLIHLLQRNPGSKKGMQLIKWGRKGGVYDFMLFFEVFNFLKKT